MGRSLKESQRVVETRCQPGTGLVGGPVTRGCCGFIAASFVMVSWGHGYQGTSLCNKVFLFYSNHPTMDIVEQLSFLFISIVII